MIRKWFPVAIIDITSLLLLLLLRADLDAYANNIIYTFTVKQLFSRSHTVQVNMTVQQRHQVEYINIVIACGYPCNKSVKDKWRCCMVIFSSRFIKLSTKIHRKFRYTRDKDE